MKPSKILFVVTEDWYFYSHRLPLAVAAKAAGHDVAVATRSASHSALIEQAGVRVIPLRRLSRSSLNPIRELAALLELLVLYWRERPDVVHHVALKPVIYGSITARLIGVSARVNALGGLGFVFSSEKFLARILRPILIRAFQIICNAERSRLILQNQDDATLVTERAGVKPSHVRLIRSAGVDLKQYFVQPLASGKPIAMLASRLLWDKGVGEFVKAAILLRKQGINARFVLVGDSDTENPSSVSRQQLQEWHDAGVVEWWGYRNDMPEVLSQARIVCLPSYYGEGIPKILIEAMACARPIITTDMPGCRDLVRSNVNGVLVAPRNADDLALALKTLLPDLSTCQRMGEEGRKIAEEDYALPRVIEETMAVYRELIDL
jgi:glycosyltransferase involved in cell wall biosynthesis